MGIGLVKETMTPLWSGLPTVARLVLVHMASTAHDYSQGDQLGRLYWGGHASLALMLDGHESPAGIRKVRRAIQALADAGAIERTNRAINGGRAVYAVTTNRRPLPVERAVDNPVDNHASPVDNAVPVGHQ